MGAAVPREKKSKPMKKMSKEATVWLSVVGGVVGLSLLSKMAGVAKAEVNLSTEGKNMVAIADQDKNVLVSLMHISEAIAYLKLAAQQDGGGDARTLGEAMKKQKRALAFIHKKCPKLKAKGWQ